jgi:kynurenine formamidase
MGPACVIDFTLRAEEDPDARLEVDDIQRWEAEHGRIPAGAVLLLHTGRSEFYDSDREAYLGYPAGRPDHPKDTKNLHFPGFHPDAAQWLTEERDIVGVGLDTPSIDHGQSRDFQVHRILGRANIWGLENLADLHLMPPTGIKK